MKKQHYMTYPERCQLEALHKARLPVRQIAEQLGFSERTIYRELKRGAYTGRDSEWRDYISYSADIAQQSHEYAQTAKGRPLKIGTDHALANFLERKIVEEHFSPAAALASAQKEGYGTEISVNTLYRYIDKEIFLKLRNKHLWRKGKKREHAQRPISRIAHPKLPSIEQRPVAISQRSEFGHWEMDLVVGKEGKGAALLTLTERMSRKEIVEKIPDKKAASVRAVFDRLEKTMPHFKETFRSLTTDNGSEFMEYNELCRSIHGGQRFDVWYCHSYSAWEKGSVENHNGIIRRFFPKGTDFTKVSKKRIQEVEDWMNNYPRKLLGWQTPNEAAGAPLG